jgi:hypothetical protein
MNYCNKQFYFVTFGENWKLWIKTAHANSDTRRADSKTRCAKIRKILILVNLQTFQSGPSQGWSHVSQILGDNNWDLWGGGREGKCGIWVAKQVQNNTRSVNKATQRTIMKRSLKWVFHKISHNCYSKGQSC